MGGKIKIAFAEYVIAACITLLAVVKFYNLHWELTGMYSLNKRWHGLATYQAAGTIMTD